MAISGGRLAPCMVYMRGVMACKAGGKAVPTDTTVSGEERVGLGLGWVGL